MTFIISATVTASVVYFAIAFISHVVKGVCDRRHIVAVNKKVEPTPEPDVPVTEDIPAIALEPEIQDATVTDYVTKNIRELRAYIRENGLQDRVRVAVGKNVSKCSKGELLMAIA